MSKVKSLFFLAIFSFLFIILDSSCFSFGEFAVSYDVSYEVKDSGITQVNQTIFLKNKTSDYYATEYTLVLVGQEIGKISAFDSLGQLKTDVKKDDNQTIIHVYFNEKVAGIEKILKWQLFYETSSFASKNGLIWEIVLPKIPEEKDLENYNVTLFIPESFGPLIYISPLPQKQKKDREFFWTINELKNGGINASFGYYQIFNFQLLYHLNNEKLIPVTTEIALPPDTSYQKVNFAEINPLPLDMRIDKDGNWLAIYNLGPKENFDVEVKGYGRIYFNPYKKDYLTKEEIKEYTSSKKFWEAESQEIKNLAKELKTPEAIYNYVVSNLEYNYQKTDRNPERLGALNTLKNKNDAICLEFTDLFIALCRAAGIPARAINGYAYTTNPKLKKLMLNRDILHAWSEYYDFSKNNWIMVDPTWGNTTGGFDYFSKLDLNHFAFIKRGYSSIYPHPPGSSKEERRKKNIYVNFSNFDKEIKEGKLDVYFYFPKKTLGVFPLLGKISLVNKGPGAVELENVEIKTNPPILNQNLTLGIIPPYGKEEIPIRINLLSENLRKRFLNSKNLILILQIKDNLYNQEIKIIPISFFLFIGGICVICIILAIFARGSRRLSLQRKK